MNKKRDIYRIAFLLCILAGVLFLIYINAAYRNNNSKNIKEDINLFNNWYIMENGQKSYIDETTDILAENDQFVLHNTLPECTIGEALFIRTNHQNIEAKIGERIIYNYEEDLKYSNSAGLGYHIISLETTDSYKDISIKYNSVYKKEQYKIFESYLGRESEIIFKIISDNIAGIAANLLMTALGVVLIIIAIVFGQQLKTKMSLYLGVFAFLFSVWSQIQLGIIQIFFDNKILFKYAGCMSFMLLPVAIILFIREILGLYEDKLLKVLLALFNLLFMSSLILDILKIKRLEDMSIYTNTLILISIGYIGLIMFNYYKHIENEKIIILTNTLTIILGMFILADIYRYYYTVSWDFAKYTRLGLIIVVGALTIVYIKDYYIKSQEFTEARMLARLAYKDVMTGLYNRTAYAEDIALLEKQLIVDPDNLDLIYVIFDLNNLKILNDFHGHCVGDYYIIKTGKIIKKAFERLGKCYRIGGDEFAVLIIGKSYSDYEKSVRELIRLIAEENKNSDIDYSLAYGCAEFVSGKYNSIYELIEIADKNMYHNKEQYKEHIIAVKECRN